MRWKKFLLPVVFISLVKKNQYQNGVLGLSPPTPTPHCLNLSENAYNICVSEQSGTDITTLNEGIEADIVADTENMSFPVSATISASMSGRREKRKRKSRTASDFIFY